MTFFMQVIALFSWITFVAWGVYFFFFVILDTSREIEDERTRTLRNSIIFGITVGLLALITTMPYLI